MREFVKVVKAKSTKLLGARAHARVSEPSHQAKREEKIWMREKGKSTRAVGDKNVRAISKNVGDFPKNVGENLEKLRRFLRNLRSLLVMLARGVCDGADNASKQRLLALWDHAIWGN